MFYDNDVFVDPSVLSRGFWPVAALRRVPDVCFRWLSLDV